jgi:hypothetical protein
MMSTKTYLILLAGVALGVHMVLGDNGAVEVSSDCSIYQGCTLGFQILHKTDSTVAAFFTLTNISNKNFCVFAVPYTDSENITETNLNNYAPIIHLTCGMESGNEQQVEIPLSVDVSIRPGESFSVVQEIQCHATNRVVDIRRAYITKSRAGDAPQMGGGRIIKSPFNKETKFMACNGWHSMAESFDEEGRLLPLKEECSEKHLVQDVEVSADEGAALLSTRIYNTGNTCLQIGTLPEQVETPINGSELSGFLTHMEYEFYDSGGIKGVYVIPIPYVTTIKPDEFFTFMDQVKIPSSSGEIFYRVRLVPPLPGEGVGLKQPRFDGHSERNHSVPEGESNEPKTVQDLQPGV